MPDLVLKKQPRPEHLLVGIHGLSGFDPTTPTITLWCACMYENYDDGVSVSETISRPVWARERLDGALPSALRWAEGCRAFGAKASERARDELDD